MNELSVSVSPHIRCGKTTALVMLDVIIALLPAAVASVIFFGARSLLVIALCVAAAVAGEAVFCLICKKPLTVCDLSAVVTGLILALNLPVSIPLWQAAIGALFATVVVKCLFGGIGQNFANPAATARVFMLLSFSGSMSAFDAVAGATPLSVIKHGDVSSLPDTLSLFLGRCGGSLGETSALALLLGGIYLLARHVISWHAPVCFIGTVFALSFLFGLPPVAEIFSGGLFLGAIFMATDYVTTPLTRRGRAVFGIGCGLITMLIRRYGSYPEGVSFSILLMNILTPYIDSLFGTKPLGGLKNEK